MLGKSTMTQDEFVAQMQRAHGEALLGVVLYGSTAARPAESGHNILVVVRTLGADALRASGAISRAWQAAGNAAPLLMTEREWRSSADVFAIEHADIAERHRVLFAADGFALGADGARGDVRRQLEYEVLALVLSVRTALAAADRDVKALRAVLGANVSRATALFRAGIRLAGEVPPGDAGAVCARAGEMAGFASAPFMVALDVRRGGKGPDRGGLEQAAQGVHDGLARFAAYVDALGVG